MRRLSHDSHAQIRSTSPFIVDVGQILCKLCFSVSALVAQFKTDREEAPTGSRSRLDANRDARAAEFGVDKARIAAMLPRDRPHHRKTQPGAAALT